MSELRNVKLQKFHLIFTAMLLHPCLFMKSQPSICPPQWYFHPENNKCYFIDKSHNHSGYNMTWPQARDVCNSSFPTGDSHVITILDNGTLTFIQDTMENKSGEYWIFLKREVDEVWRWQDTGMEQNIAELNLRQEGASTENVDCVAYDEGFRFRDCENHTAMAICEIPDVDPCRRKDNGGCQEFCLNDGLAKKLCACRPGLTLTNGTDCIDNGCPHICEYYCDKETGMCQCPSGYVLKNLTQCQDINECSHNNGGCEQLCNNTSGSHFCHCKKSFRKEGNFCIYHVLGKAIVGDQVDHSRSTLFLVLVCLATIIIIAIAIFHLAQNMKQLRLTKAQHNLMRRTITQSQLNNFMSMDGRRSVSLVAADNIVPPITNDRKCVSLDIIPESVTESDTDLKVVKNAKRRVTT